MSWDILVDKVVLRIEFLKEMKEKKNHLQAYQNRKNNYVDKSMKTM